MNRDNEIAKPDNEPAAKAKRKGIIISLFMILIVGWALRYMYLEYEIYIAKEKVGNLFEVVDEDEEKPSKIKASTNQALINDAQKAVNNINTNGEEEGRNEGVVFALQSALVVAQAQLMKREGEIESTTFPAPDPEEQQQLVDYQPNVDDVVSTYDDVENRDILEEFIEIAGENGKNDESEIRIVKNEGKNGVIIYDLKSRYDKNADQGWIDVTPDLSHYNPPEEYVQEIFNNASQQCGYMSKDETQGFYKLYECRTHWEYHLLPIDKSKLP